MSITYRGGRVIEFTIEDTVGFTLPPAPDLAATVRIYPPFRRPDATGENPIYVPRTIGIVDPVTATDALPEFIQYALRPARPTYLDRRRYNGRRRAATPARISLAARLRRLFGGAR